MYGAAGFVGGLGAAHTSICQNAAFESRFLLFFLFRIGIRVLFRSKNPPPVRYMYNNMYSDSWGMHRRRRYGDFHNQNFCIVTDPGSRNGAFMACEQCYHLYGLSLSE